MTDSKDLIVPIGAIVLPHELRTATQLMRRGYKVEFIVPEKVYYRKSPDILLNGVIYEMKAPIGGQRSTIEQNLKRALRQADRIVFDSHRMKTLPDDIIEVELTKHFKRSSKIKSLLFVRRDGSIVDIGGTMLL